jgi:hypothetical protein
MREKESERRGSKYEEREREGVRGKVREERWRERREREKKNVRC